MADGNLLRLGGACGLLAVAAMVPANLVGYPGAPGSLMEAQTCFEAGPGMFVFSNGVLPLLHIFFLLFLGVLYGMLRSAAGEDNLQKISADRAFSFLLWVESFYTALSDGGLHGVTRELI